jgi:outer membrane protein
MKTSLMTPLFVLGATLLSIPAQAQTTTATEPEGKWLVRLRALNLQPANKSKAFSAGETSFASNAISVNSKWFPEVDVTYFFTKNIAAELVLTYPQEQTVRLNGARLGTFKHLPPTLSAQYHFDIPKAPVKPYVSLGLNFTIISDVNLSAGETALDLSDTSFGFSFGAGVDYKLTKQVYLNLDYKHIDLNADVKVKSTGAKLTEVQVDPNLFSFGVGYRF